MNPEQAFCGSCGVRLAVPATAPIETPAAVPFSSPPPGGQDLSAVVVQTPDTVSPSKKPKWLIPVIGGALAAAVIGGIVASKDDSSSKADSSADSRATTKPTTGATQPDTTALDCPPGEHATPFGECEADPTTTREEEEGSRENPFDPNFLTYGDYDSVSLGSLEPVDFALIEDANRFNDPPPAGQIYVRYKVTATYNGTETGTAFDFSFSLGLVGDKGKIYETAFVSDSDGILDALSDQPDVISGGVLMGYLYYLIDGDDTNMLVVNENSDGNVFIDITP